MAEWNKHKQQRDARLAAGAKFASGKLVDKADAVALLEAVIRSGDRVCLEGDNQKQADFLARALADVDPKKIHDLHIVQSGIVLPEHLDILPWLGGLLGRTNKHTRLRTWGPGVRIPPSAPHISLISMIYFA
jgi:hypothetical protein